MDEAWLDSVRIARDGGCLSSLFPRGIDKAWDLPHTIHRAIVMALWFLGFETNLEPKERPPRHIWLDSEKLKAHFERVQADRKAKAEGDDTSDMPQNELIKEMFGGRFG